MLDIFTSICIITEVYMYTCSCNNLYRKVRCKFFHVSFKGKTLHFHNEDIDIDSVRIQNSYITTSISCIAFL